MANRPGQKIKMTSIDELLCVPDIEGIIDIDVKTIYPFENHPFKVVDDDKMEELVESIAANGVLTPILVRPDDEGTYEMISGHRRLHAAKRAGLIKFLRSSRKWLMMKRQMRWLILMFKGKRYCRVRKHLL